jgi:hypothetical protein
MGIDPRKVIKNPGELLRGLELLRDDAREIDAEQIPEDAGFLWKLVHLNPALYRGFVLAAFAIAGGFGFVASDKTTEAVFLGITALVAIIQALWTRGAVIAKKKVVVYKPDPVDEPTKVAAGEAVSTNAVAVINAAAINVNTVTKPLEGSDQS